MGERKRIAFSGVHVNPCKLLKKKISPSKLFSVITYSIENGKADTERVGSPQSILLSIRCITSSPWFGVYFC